MFIFALSKSSISCKDLSLKFKVKILREFTERSSLRRKSLFSLSFSSYNSFLNDQAEYKIALKITAVCLIIDSLNATFNHYIFKCLCFQLWLDLFVPNYENSKLWRKKIFKLSYTFTGSPPKKWNGGFSVPCELKVLYFLHH